jgi:uncharacterized protein (TIGR03083 family)
VDDPFATIASERLALADLLETLTDEQWATRSLCGAWTVKDVAAHVMVGPTVSKGEFLTAMLRARGRFAVANRAMVASRARLSTTELVALIREHADSRFRPPGMDWHAPWTEILVHREDIAVPLGGFPRAVEPWGPALDFLVGDRATRGFRYAATDLDWSHGSGAEVAGPAASLAIAIAGRPAGLEHLSGGGFPTFEAWVRHAGS